ncbi:CoA pyrophosphatase [Gallaecimonas kandeliae]|uniref:CoA pyrophosphatase n=1 Tax=Gallaecimonas kandeliae TaxID=3029055 RepID=UPI002648D352|nr:CoA pyrophosphatase [Gallaecimonas kandeliae]WKE67118.1 CoA pyrophosphatase [Gallaecimonas kandeliae]
MRRSFTTDFLLRPLEPRAPGLQLATPREAAVLIAVLDKPEPSILLTRRTSTLRHHGGQVALPGGRVDATDPDHAAAALREAWEEVGLPPSEVQPLGRLNPYHTVSRYRITPVVGLAPADFPWQLSTEEVDAVFEVPLSVVLDLNAYQVLTIPRLGQSHDVYFLPWNGWLIWGATAAIFQDLALHLR